MFKNKQQLIEELKILNGKYEPNGFKLVSLFGSYARETNNSFSDIDLTYKIDFDRFYKDDAFGALQKMEEIKKELEMQFHKKVDLISINTKNPMLQKSLQAEQVMI